MRTATATALISLVVLATSGCGTFPIDRSTRTPEATQASTTSTATPASAGPSASPSADTGFTADGALLLTPTSVGALTIDETAADVAAVTGRDYSGDLAAFGGSCATFTLTETGPYRGVYALAASQGATGHIDVYALTGGATPDDPPARTAEGIGIGSTLDDIVAAYPGQVTYKPSYYDPQNQQAFVVSGGVGMAFTVNGAGTVIGWAVGRVEQLGYIEGCA